MRVLVAVDVADLLHRARHAADAAEVVEEHESRVEVDALEDVVGDEHAQEVLTRLLLLELVVEVTDEGVAREQVLVILPLEDNLLALVGAHDRVEHVAVALRVHALLE